MRLLGRTAVAVVLLLPGGLQSARGQEAGAEGGAARADSAGTGWLPGSFIIAPLRAKPREVKLRAGAIAVDRDLEPDYEGRHAEAQVDLGYRIPVVRIQAEARARPGLDLGFEVGTYSRFERDFVSIDFRVGFPLSIRYRKWDFRITPFHESSHVGDEYQSRFSREPRDLSRESFELLAGFRPAEAWRAYLGGDLNVGRGTDREMDRWRLRFGVEWDTTVWSDRLWGPYAAADLETDDVSDRLSATVVAGLAVRLRSWRLLADLEFHDGRSPMRQFGTVNESFWGFNLTFEPMCACRPKL